jgi:hypothetical protein
MILDLPRSDNYLFINYAGYAIVFGYTIYMWVTVNSLFKKIGQDFVSPVMPVLHSSRPSGTNSSSFANNNENDEHGGSYYENDDENSRGVFTESRTASPKLPTIA